MDTVYGTHFTISNTINARCYEKMREMPSAERLTAEVIPIRDSCPTYLALSRASSKSNSTSLSPIHNLSLKSSNDGFHPNCTCNRRFCAWSRSHPWQELGFTGPGLAAHQRRRSARPDYRYWHLPYGLTHIVYSCRIWHGVPEGSGP